MPDEKTETPKLELVRNKIEPILEALREIAKQVNGIFPRLLYATSYNIDHLESIANIIQKAQTAAVKEYETARLKLCAEYANKDAAGNPIQIPVGPKETRYDIPPSKAKEFQIELSSLRVKHDMDEAEKKWAEWMEGVEPVSHRPLIIGLKKMPPSLNADMLARVTPLVEWKEEEETR